MFTGEGLQFDIPQFAVDPQAMEPFAVDPQAMAQFSAAPDMSAYMPSYADLQDRRGGDIPQFAVAPPSYMPSYADLQDRWGGDIPQFAVAPPADPVAVAPQAMGPFAVAPPSYVPSYADLQDRWGGDIPQFAVAPPADPVAVAPPADPFAVAPPADPFAVAPPAWTRDKTGIADDRGMGPDIADPLAVAPPAAPPNGVTVNPQGMTEPGVPTITATPNAAFDYRGLSSGEPQLVKAGASYLNRSTGQMMPAGTDHYVTYTNDGDFAGTVMVAPGQKIRMVDSKTGDVVFEGSGPEGAKQVTAIANAASQDRGRRAAWSIEAQNEQGGYTRQASERYDPKNPNLFQTLLPIAVAILGSVLLPGIGTAIGIGGLTTAAGGATALGAGLGAAAGTAGLGAVRGDPLKDILLNSAISGIGAGVVGPAVGKFAAGLGGTTGVAAQALPGAVNLVSTPATLASGIAGISAPQLASIGASVMAKGVENTIGELVIQGVLPATATQMVSSAIGAGVGGALGAATGTALNASDTATSNASDRPLDQGETPVEYLNVSPAPAPGPSIGVPGPINPGGLFTPGAMPPSVSRPPPVFQDEELLVEGVRPEPEPVNPVNPVNPATLAAVAAGVGGLSAATGAGAQPPPQFESPEVLVEGVRPPVPITIDPGTLAAVAAVSAPFVVPSLINAIKSGDPKQVGDWIKANPKEALQLGLTAAGIGAAIIGGGGGGGSRGGFGVSHGPGTRSSLSPTFSAGLPPPSFGVRTPRDVTVGNRYAIRRPEASFFSNVPQRGIDPFSVMTPSQSQMAGIGDLNNDGVINDADRVLWRKRFAGQGYAKGGRTKFAVKGDGDGRSDSIPAVLSDGEYVIDAETVALLGNGSSKAGADQLDKFRISIRKHKGRDLAKGRFSVKARDPQHYLTGGRV